MWYGTLTTLQVFFPHVSNIMWQHDMWLKAATSCSTATTSVCVCNFYLTTLSPTTAHQSEMMKFIFVGYAPWVITTCLRGGPTHITSRHNTTQYNTIIGDKTIQYNKIQTIKQKTRQTYKRHLIKLQPEIVCMINGMWRQSQWKHEQDVSR